MSVKKSGKCMRPYHETSLVNFGGPHGKVARPPGHQRRRDGPASPPAAQSARSAKLRDRGRSGLRLGVHGDVMGYHTAAEIPNYWKYAQDFVLQDHMFQSDLSWSLPSHLYMVSGWSAACSKPNDPMSCANRDRNVAIPPAWVGPSGKPPAGPDYAWTDITYLLHQAGVSWGYYVFPGTQPDCDDDKVTCKALPQNAQTPGIWNPLPYFDTVRQDKQLKNIQPIANFYGAAKAGTLPAVSWVTPADSVSEHPPSSVGVGEDYVTGLINTIMKGPDWNSTAIFLAWDDWGGFYDHVRPPRADQNGYGLACACPCDQPVCEAGVHRPSDAEFRRVSQVHRGRLPRRATARPDDGRAPRSSARRARERLDPREHRERLRLQPDTPRSRDPPAAERRSDSLERRKATGSSGTITQAERGSHQAPDLVHRADSSELARKRDLRAGAGRHPDLLRRQVRPSMASSRSATPSSQSSWAARRYHIAHELDDLGR